MMKLAILLLGVIAGQAYGDAPEAIVGGNNAGRGQFSHQVSLQTPGGFHFCGGSIISPTHILTAAHCMSDQSLPAVVVPGINNLRRDKIVKYNIKRYINHPRYNPSSLQNDISVIQIDRPIPFNNLQSPINLAPQGFVTDGKPCIVSGWGGLGANIGGPDDLQFVVINALNTKTCQSYGSHRHITDDQVCTLADRVGKGACRGDSGGPLIMDNMQIGVVSWGIPCALGQPDVFTRVSNYHKFINDCKAAMR